MGKWIPNFFFGDPPVGGPPLRVGSGSPVDFKSRNRIGNPQPDPRLYLLGDKKLKSRKTRL